MYSGIISPEIVENTEIYINSDGSYSCTFTRNADKMGRAKYGLIMEYENGKLFSENDYNKSLFYMNKRTILNTHPDLVLIK